MAGDWVVANTTAYWCYDFLLIVRWYKTLAEPGIMIHHLVGIFPFALGRLHSELLYYGAMIILTELSTPFVNNRWFIVVVTKCTNADLSAEEIVNGILIWFSFVICRIYWQPYMLYSMYLDRDEIMKGHFYVYSVVTFGCFVACILSYFWFFKITKGIAKKLTQMKGPKKQH